MLKASRAALLGGAGVTCSDTIYVSSCALLRMPKTREAARRDCLNEPSLMQPRHSAALSFSSPFAYLRDVSLGARRRPRRCVGRRAFGTRNLRNVFCERLQTAADVFRRRATELYRPSRENPSFFHFGRASKLQGVSIPAPEAHRHVCLAFWRARVFLLLFFWRKGRT